GVKIIKQICDFQKNIAKEVGASKMQVIKKEVDKDLEKEVKKLAGFKLEQALFQKDKKELNTKLDELFNFVAEEIKDKFGADKLKDAFNILNKLKDNLIKNNILEKEIRPDGRAIDEIRPISFETGLLPRTHGSGLFTRGMTKSLNIVTLGSPGDEKLIEGMEIQEKKRYMHNYNFPPFSVGEASPLRGPSRRDIGHGALAEKALKPVIPNSDVFPYTIRTVSEILSSNGSTSMASTCSSTLALMDAGVPIKSPVAGISIGLVYESEDNYKLLTDISGIEDGSGHMDFKVAGTEKGITAMQLDIKIEGLPIKVLKEALERAKKMRLFIIKEMKKVINAPREDLSKFAPRVIILKIDPKKIGMVIGSGGKTINEIIDSTGVKIDIEDDGSVFITSENKESGEEAKKIVENLVKEFKEGDVIKGKVVTIVDFGAFVELSPGRDGLIHVSQMGNTFVKTVHDVLKEGQEVEVKVIGVDPSGKIKLKLLN
ncbi:MAG: polyribonucleotide nucleotidyltransferase, partial [Patescibacteria group bacterium]